MLTPEDLIHGETYLCRSFDENQDPFVGRYTDSYCDYSSANPAAHRKRMVYGNIPYLLHEIDIYGEIDLEAEAEKLCPSN